MVLKKSSFSGICNTDELALLKVEPALLSFFFILLLWETWKITNEQIVMTPSVFLEVSLIYFNVDNFNN